MVAQRVIAVALGVILVGLWPAGEALYAQADRGLPEVTRAVALVDARIVQAPGRVIERGTVVVRDGVITGVGTDIDIPYDAERIDADSLTVYAGFIDGLSHAGMPQPEKDRRERREEVDQPGSPPDELAGIQPYRKAADLFDSSDERIEKLRGLGFTTAHVVPRGDMLPGRGALVFLKPAGQHRAVFQEERGMFARFGTAPGMYPGTEMGVLAKFRQLYREAQRRRRAQEVYAEQPEGNKHPPYDPVHHAFFPVIAGDQQVFFHTDRALEIYRALELREETGAPMVLTGLYESFKTLSSLQSADVPLFLTLDLPDEPADSTVRDTLAAELAASYDPGFYTRSYRDIRDERANLRARRQIERHRYASNAARLHEAGLSFGFTSLDVKPEEIPEHLRTMIRHGLPEEAALAGLTTYPARVFGLEQSLGTVEAGKIGNLVVTNGSLFDERTDIRYVFVDGRKFEYDRSETDQEEERAAGDSAEIPVPGLPEHGHEPRRTGDLLVQNGTILTITNGRLEATDILIRDGTIVEIGKDLDPPGGVKIIDASDNYVIPGIVDAHSHIAIDAINEATSPVTAEVRVGDVLDPYDLDLYRALAGGVTVSHLMHGSANVIGGQNETIKHRYGMTDPSALKMEGAPRTIKFALGENPTRVHGERNHVQPLSRMGVEFVIRRALNEAQRYDQRWETYRRSREQGEDVIPPAYNERLEIIAGILDGEIQVHCHSYRADEILMLMDVLEEFDIDNITFQHVNEGFKVAPELAEFGAGASVFSDWWSYKFEVYYSTAYNAAILAKNGVLTSINSDSPELNRHLYHEAAKSQRYGDLSDAEALSLITINPARQLGIDNRVGSIEVGKDGDLAIFNEHPLSVYAICQNTIVDGLVRFDVETDPDDMRLQVDPETPLRQTTIRQDGSRHFCLRDTGGGLYEFMREALHD